MRRRSAKTHPAIICVKVAMSPPEEATAKIRGAGDCVRVVTAQTEWARGGNGHVLRVYSLLQYEQERMLPCNSP